MTATTPRLRYLKATVATPAGQRFTTYDIGWLPGEGWFCDCGKAGCVHVETVKEAVR